MDVHAYCSVTSQSIPTPKFTFPFKLDHLDACLLVFDTRLVLLYFDIQSEQFCFLLDRYLFGRILDCQLLNTDRHILVCSSDSGHLSFLSIVHSTTTLYAFQLLNQFKISDKLPSYQNVGFKIRYPHLPNLLSIDHQYRAILLSAFESNVSFSKISLLDLTISNTDVNFKRDADLSGCIIWDTTFLYSSSTNPTRTQFIIVTTKEKHLIIRGFEYSENHTIKKYNSINLGEDSRFLHLIALPGLPESFIIITTLGLYLIDATHLNGQLNIVYESAIPNSINAVPMYFNSNTTNFKSAIISSYIVDECEMPGIQRIWLMNENGNLLRCSVCLLPPSIEYFSVTKFNNQISKMCFLSKNEDILHLLIFGSQNDSELVMIKAKRQMIRYHPSVTLSSITPVYDFTFAPIWNHSTRTELPDCERLYVASGSHPQSRLSVITSQPFLHTLQSSPHGDILTGIWTVCIQGMVLVVLGYPSCTKLLYVKDHGIQGIEFEDISELSWINSNCETRSIGTVSNSLIQIQKSELQLSIPKYKSTTVKAKRWIPTTPINIIDGIFNDEYVIMYTSNPSTLIVLKVLADVQSDSLFVDQISSIALDFQVSCIYHPSSALHFRVVPEPIIILGTFQPSLKIITLNSLLTSMLCLHTIDLSLFADMFLNIPHSIILVSDSDDCFLLTSLRNGNVVSFRWKIEEGKICIGYGKSNLIGHLPAKFIQNECVDFVFAFNDSIPWKFQIIQNQLILTKIVYDQKIHHAIYLYRKGSKDNYIMINENFSIVEMDESMNSNRIFQILLDQIPKHVIYDQTTQKLFVCFERMGKGSMIKVIDPHTKKSVKDVFLKDKETVTCVTIWNLKSTKRYICVGTKGYRDSNGIWGGRVLVYSLKLKSDKINYSLNQPGGYEFPHSVTAIKSYGPYLLVASGRTLNQLKIDESARTIVLGATIKLRSHTHSISTVEKYIFLGCIEDSICIYKAAFHEKKFIPITCDDIPHEIVDCIAFKQTLHSHIIFSLNTYQCINGYRFDDQKSILIQHLTFNLQEICLKFSMANLSTDIISSIENPIELNDFDFHLDWDIKLPKKFIYCISNQGTLYKLTKLSSFIYTILIFIQDLLELHPNTKPLLGGTLKSFRSTPYQQYQNMIDGLFIKQFCKLNESDRKSIMIHFNDWWVHVFQIKYRNSVLVGGEALLIKKDVVLATDIDVIIQRLES